MEDKIWGKSQNVESTGQQSDMRLLLQTSKCELLCDMFRHCAVDQHKTMLHAFAHDNQLYIHCQPDDVHSAAANV